MNNSAPTGSAVSAALKFLSRRPRSIIEVRDRLEAQGFGEAEADSALKILLEAGYLNDEKYARILAGSRLGRRRWGRLKIAAELSSKGVAPEHIKTALAGIGHADEKAAARAALSKWLRKASQGAPLDRDGRAKAARFLKGRGFTAEAIASAVSVKDADTAEDAED